MRLKAGALERQPFYIQRTLVELGDPAAKLTDKVMVMVLGQLVARPVTEVQPAHEPQTPQKIQGTVDRYEADVRASPPYSFEALVLLRLQCLQDRDPLWRSLVASTPHLAYGRS